MPTLVQRIKRYLLLGAIFTISGFVAIKGCYEFFPESTFELASESRLPKWITLPPGLTRDNVSLTLSFYSIPWVGDAQFILRDKNGHILKKETGRTRCKVPFLPQNPPEGFPPGYPIYEAITVHGIADIIEHRKMEPIFYVTDDTAAWELYESIGCR